MTRYTLTYLAGVLTMAAVVYFAGGRPTLAAFVAGMAAVALALAAAIASSSRMRRAARFLSILADAVDGREAKRERKPVPHICEESPSQVQLEVEEALRGLGASKKESTAAARLAIALKPEGTTKEVLALAFARLRSAA